MSILAAFELKYRQPYGAPMKKKSLPPDRLDECAALKSIFWEKRKSLGLTQEKAAAALGMNQGSFSHYLNGRNALNVDFAAKAANLLGVPVRAFSQRLANEIVALANANADIPQVMDIREGMVTVSASLELDNPNDSKPWRMSYWYPIVSWDELALEYGGNEPPHFFKTATAPFSETGGSFSTANAGELSCWLRVRGPSMLSSTSPSFAEGTLILVRFRRVEMANTFFYIARNKSGELSFKQLLIESGVSYLASLNPAFKPVEMGNDWELIGRVVDARIVGL